MRCPPFGTSKPLAPRPRRLNPGTRLPLLPLTGTYRHLPSHPPGRSAAAWAAKGALDKGSESTKKWVWGPKAPLPGLWDKWALGASALTATRRPSKREKGKSCILHSSKPAWNGNDRPVQSAAGARLMAFAGRRNGGCGGSCFW